MRSRHPRERRYDLGEQAPMPATAHHGDKPCNGLLSMYRSCMFECRNERLCVIMSRYHSVILSVLLAHDALGGKDRHARDLFFALRDRAALLGLSALVRTRDDRRALVRELGDRFCAGGI